MLEKILSIIAPHECLGCAQEGPLLCQKCAQRLTPIPERCYRCRKVSAGFETCPKCRRASSLYSVRAVTNYSILAQQVVYKLKFHSARAAATDMALYMERLLTDGAPTLITHVPTATTRVRQRSYDQAQLLAKSLAKNSCLPYAVCLRRFGQDKQVGASRRERLIQLQKAFQPTDISLIKNAHVVLVDDVLTTGATLEAAAATLRKAGAKRVDGLVFAQA